MTKLPLPKTGYLILFLLLSSLSIYSQVLINEFSAANRNFYFDNYGDNADWIELYNTGSNNVNLSGYYLSDNISRLTKWKIPNGVSINAGDHLLIYATGRDQYTPGGLHAGFKLTQSKNEYIVLSSPDSTVLDAIQIVISNQTNHSRGRVEDGSTEWGIFDFPTPNIPNNNALKEYAAKPIFETAPGFYTSDISVSILAEANTIIRYTTDGREPNSSSSMYTGPIELDETTVIKAKVYSNDPEVPPSFTEVNTYFINEDHTVPVISVSSSEVSTLLSGEDNGEHVTHIEYYNASDDFEFEMLGHFKGHGNDSWNLSQRGIRFYVKDYYGYANKIDYPLFPTSDRTDFDVFILKAGASDNYPRSDIQWGRPSCHLRDVYVQSLSDINGLNVDKRRYSRCVMYVNGEYWGVYEMRERMDADYTNYYYDQEEEHVDMLEYWGGLDVRYGSSNDWEILYDFMINNDLSISSNFDYVASELDLSSLIDYIIINTFVVNTDWLNWNTKWWRGRKGEGTKWRYTLWDMDNVFNLGQNYTGLPSTGWESDPCDVEGIYDDAEAEIGHITMLVALFENEEFVQMYINRYADLASTVFTCESMLGYLDEMVAELEPEMQRQVDRWGGSISEWEENLAFLRNEIENKCTVIAEQVGDCYEDEGITGPYDIIINVEPPLSGKVQVNTAIGTEYPWEATYFGGIEIDLTALPENEWTFDHWEVNNNAFGPNELANAINMSLTAGDEITAFFISDCAAVPGLTGPSFICEGDTVMLSANSGFANYLWSNNSNESTLEITSGGIYRLTVTDNLGCENSAEILVEENLIPLIQLEGNTSICEGEMFEIDPGTGFETYVWSNGTTEEILVTNLPGNYSVTVTNENGCTNTESFVLEMGAILPPVITGSTSICENESTLLSVDEGYDKYQWSDGTFGNSIEVSEPGVYNLTVSDASGCTKMNSVTVEEFEVTPPAISGSETICPSSSGILSVDPNYTSYLWSNANTTSSININSAGTYELTVTDINGCQSFNSFTVEESDNLSPVVNGLTSICIGSSTILDAGDNYASYVWSNGSLLPTTEIFEPGNYSLTVTDASGCSGETTVSISEAEILPPTIIGDESICDGSTIELSVSEVYANYLWSTNDVSSSIIIDAAGVYTLEVTDVNGCQSMSAFTIVESESLNPVITGEAEICSGNATFLGLENTFASYIWSNGMTTSTIEVNVPGMYSVTVNDENGCDGMTSINVETIAITPPAISGDPAICPGGSTTLSTNDGYVSYLWSTNDIEQNIEIDQPGTYGVTVTDVNGCISSGFFIVEESELLSISIEGVLDICPGETTTLSLANDYDNYIWSNNVFAESNLITQSGFYSVTVTDDSGCTGVDIVSVIENEVPEPIIEGDAFLCEGASGLLSVENIYTSIIWSNGFTSPLSPVNTAGIYSVSVTNEENCLGIDEITVAAASEVFSTETVNLCLGEIYNGTTYFESTQLINESTSYQGCDSTHTIELNVASAINLNLNGSGGCGFGGTIDATVSGNGNYTYQWSNGAMTSDLANLNEGTYTLTVTDEFGCSEIASETLTLATPPSVSTFSNIIVCYGDMNGEIDLEITNGTPPFNINWSNGMTGTHLEGLSGGTYSVVISDANGCNVVSAVTIPEPSKLYAGFDGTPATNGNNGVAAANVSGGVLPYAYQWSTGATSNVISGLSDGEYSLTVTDANGCTSEYVGDLNSIITGIENIEHLLSFDLYPNPSNGRFVLSMELSQRDEVELQIFDILGKKVKNIKQSGQEIYFHMDMQELTQGSYFLIVRFSEGYFTRKIVIAK